jgi:hypothetical protein
MGVLCTRVPYSSRKWLDFSRPHHNTNSLSCLLFPFSFFVFFLTKSALQSSPLLSGHHIILYSTTKSTITARVLIGSKNQVQSAGLEIARPMHPIPLAMHLFFFHPFMLMPHHFQFFRNWISMDGACGNSTWQYVSKFLLCYSQCRSDDYAAESIQPNYTLYKKFEGRR